jgi:hypothetical protein
MSDHVPLDPKQFGRSLAENALNRRHKGITRRKLAAVYGKQLAGVANKMVKSGTSKHAVADWLEAVTAAFRERMGESSDAPDKEPEK